MSVAIAFLAGLLVVAAVRWRKASVRATEWRTMSEAAERRATIAETASDALGKRIKLHEERDRLSAEAMTNAAEEIAAWRNRWIKSQNNCLELAHQLNDLLKKSVN